MKRCFPAAIVALAICVSGWTPASGQVSAPPTPAASRMRVLTPSVRSSGTTITLKTGLDPRLRAAMEKVSAEGTEDTTGKTPAAPTIPPIATDAELTQKRMELLQALVFDRRPSAILKAWSQPLEVEPEDSQADSDEVSADEADAAIPEATPDESVASEAASEKSGAEEKPSEDSAADEAETKKEDTGESSPEEVAAEKAKKEAAEKAEREAAEKAKKEAAEASARGKAFQTFQKSLERLKFNVTIGDWAQVDEFLRELEDGESVIVFAKILESMQAGSPDGSHLINNQDVGERHVVRIEDVIAIAELSPQELNDAQVSQLSMLTREAIRQGQTIDRVVVAVREHAATEPPPPVDNTNAASEESEQGDDATPTPDETEDGATPEETDEKDPDAPRQRRLTRRNIARILFQSGNAEESEEFLPSLDEAIAEDDHEALNLLSDIFVARSTSKASSEMLELAWKATQAVLASEEQKEDTPDEATVTTPAQPANPAAAMAAAMLAAAGGPQSARDKALQRAVELAPQVSRELGEQWLIDSFKAKPERGMEILRGIGSRVAGGMLRDQQNVESRVRILKLQKTAVEELLELAPERAKEWQPALHLLARNWLREAEWSREADTSTTRGQRLQRDQWGNYYWVGNSYSYSGRQGPQAIPSGDILDAAPSEEWLAILEPGYRPSFAMVTARLHLRVKEEDLAFPHIAALAETHPKQATELVEEFLKVWGENHNPNSDRYRSNVYMFSYGFNQRTNGIPLTRSRQERNLKELADWVAKIRELPIDDMDETWVLKAFRSVHSDAEVFQLDDIETVMGDVKQLKPETLAELLQTMRANLVGVWRAPEVQQQNKTNRKKKDIEAEVLHGYEIARSLVDQSLAENPDEWSLILVDAALQHDENDYRNDLARSSEFSNHRRAAMARFAQAAQAYVATVDQLPDDELNGLVFNQWFWAALGASDLDKISQDHVPDLTQMEHILTSIQSMPERLADKHQGMFANDLFTHMSNVNPAVKFRYVREGMSIAGDHEQTREAKQLLDYYNDLVTEIELETVVDGSSNVGHEQPFGVFVNLRHTKDIERESGGFGRYLQNQNNAMYAFNYGRPTENYRDKFEQTVRDSLDEHFEVLSVTFEPEDVNSRATQEYGWRITPYAYILVKARGPEIDRLAPVRLDLDFMDTTGYVVLPVESQALALNCSSPKGDIRPVNDVTITQTLDERQADEGKLMLEIRAAGQGLIPELEDLVNLTFADFEVSSVEDDGVAVSRFDPDSDDVVIISERLWTIALTDREKAAEGDRTFAFPVPRTEPKEVIYQRHVDEDLVSVESTITLEEEYDRPQYARLLPILVAGGAIAVLAIVGLLVWLLRPRKKQQKSTLEMPEQITPFTVLGLLRMIQENNGFGDERRAELSASIRRIEGDWFGNGRVQTEKSREELVGIAQEWLGRSSRK